PCTVRSSNSGEMARTASKRAPRGRGSEAREQARSTAPARVAPRGLALRTSPSRWRSRASNTRSTRPSINPISCVDPYSSRKINAPLAPPRHKPPSTSPRVVDSRAAGRSIHGRIYSNALATPVLGASRWPSPGARWNVKIDEAYRLGTESPACLAARGLQVASDLERTRRIHVDLTVLGDVVEDGARVLVFSTPQRAQIADELRRPHRGDTQTHS